MRKYIDLCLSRDGVFWRSAIARWHRLTTFGAHQSESQNDNDQAENEAESGVAEVLEIEVSVMLALDPTRSTLRKGEMRF